jgi:hypothetical protein
LIENKSDFVRTEGFDREKITEPVVHICTLKNLRRTTEVGNCAPGEFILRGEAPRSKTLPLSFQGSEFVIRQRVVFCSFAFNDF